MPWWAGWLSLKEAYEGISKSFPNKTVNDKVYTGIEYKEEVVETCQDPNIKRGVQLISFHTIIAVIITLNAIYEKY